MRNDIDLLASRFFTHFPDPLGKFFSRRIDRSCGLLIAVENLRAICLEFARDTPPVIEETEVSEEYAVHHEDRIFRRADLL